MMVSEIKELIREVTSSSVIFKTFSNTYVPSLGKSTISVHQLKSTFGLYLNATSIQKHQKLDNRFPDMLLQMAFYRCCKTTKVQFVVLIGLHGVPGCSSYQSWPLLWIVSVCVTHCEGTALLFESKWLR